MAVKTFEEIGTRKVRPFEEIGVTKVRSFDEIGVDEPEMPDRDDILADYARTSPKITAPDQPNPFDLSKPLIGKDLFDELRKRPIKRIPGLGKTGIVERAGKQFTNRIVLDTIESWRPSSLYAKGSRQNAAKMKYYDELGGQWEDIPFKDKITKFPQYLWADFRSLYGNESRAKQAIAHAKLVKKRGSYNLQLPPPEGMAEFGVDIAAGLSAFILKLWLLKKAGTGTGVIPKQSIAGDMVVWETLGLIEQDIPGKMAAVRGGLGAIGKIPTGSITGKLAKTGAESTLFATTTAATGGSKEEIIVSALLPVAFNTWHFAKQRSFIKNYEQNLKTSAIKAYHKRIREGESEAWSKYRLESDRRLIETSVARAKYKIYQDDAFAPAKDKWQAERQKALKMLASGNSRKARIGNDILNFLDKLPGIPSKSLTQQIKEAKQTTRAIQSEKYQRPAQIPKEAPRIAKPAVTRPISPPGQAVTPLKPVEGIVTPPKPAGKVTEGKVLNANRIIEKVDDNSITDEQAASFIRNRMAEAAEGKVEGIDILAVSALKTADNLTPILRQLASAAGNQMSRVQAGQELLTPEKLAAVSGIEIEEIRKFIEGKKPKQELLQAARPAAEKLKTRAKERVKEHGYQMNQIVKLDEQTQGRIVGATSTGVQVAIIDKEGETAGYATDFSWAKLDTLNKPPAAEVETPAKRTEPKVEGRPGFIDVTPLAKAHKSIVNIIESAKPVEIKYGKEVSAEVIKGIHNVDVARIEFNEAEIENLDSSLQEFGEQLSKYSKSILTNLMAARGKPAGKSAILIKNEALKALAKEAPELIGIRKMITRIADFNYKYLQKVVGDDIKYIEDYFYGTYKDAKKVERFLDYWRTTKRFTKEKKLPTVADALSYGLELRDPNPVNNLRSEYMAIAYLDGMIQMRDELLKLGKDKFISDNPGLLAEPEKIPDPVFKGLYVDEPLAQMIKSLISTSKVHKIPALNTLRRVNNVMRSVKFAGSMFHHLSVLKQSIVDSGYLGFLLPHRWVGIHQRSGKTIPYGLHKETAARGFTFGFRTNDPIFKTRFYRRYIKNGGGHRYSIESQAQRMITNSVDKFNSTISKPIKAALFVPQIPIKYVKWMFQSYIPKVKYMKTVDEYNKRTKKLGRDLTDAELQEIIKEGQNFYGMMNERLFGRSATTTQLLRFRFMSPGYWFGNIRSIGKGGIQWGGGKQFRASRSRANIVNSFLLTGMAAAIGTLIMTGKRPKKPETKEDIRDLFKIDTGFLDAQGNRIMIDLMTYDKDYWNIYGKLLVGQAGEIPGDVWRRIGGMTALSFDILSDFNQMAMGRAIYDWKGDKVTEITDPFAQRVMSLVWHEFQKAEPISVSVFSQARRKDLNNLQAGMLMLLGVRLTKTEKAKREQQIRTRIFSLFDRQESLYYYLGTIKEPKKHIEHYNRIVNSIFDNPITTDEMRKKYYKGRIIDIDRLLSNKAYYLTSPNRTADEIKRATNYLRNFGVTSDQAQEYLKKYWARERKKTPVSPLERDRVIGRTRKRRRLRERMEGQ